MSGALARLGHHRPTRLLSALCLLSVTLLAILPRPALSGPHGQATIPIAQWVLPNGLKVIVVEKHERPLVTVTCAIKSGGAEEAAAQAGLADLTAKLLLRGTQSKTAAELTEMIDYLGASMAISTDWDATTLKVTALSRVLPQLLDLISEMLQRPSFPEEEMEMIKTSAAGKLGDPDNLWQVADQAFNQALFAGHRYALPLSGSGNGLASIRRKDVFRYYQNHYAPNNALIILAGDVTPSEVEPTLARRFGEWAKREVHRSSIALPSSKAEPRIVLVDRPAATQAQLRLGFLAASRAAPEVAALRIVNAILGERLTQELRTRRTITYGVSSLYDLRKIPGPFMVWTFTQPAHALEAITAAQDVVTRLAEQGPTPEEFNNMRERFRVGSWALLELPDTLSARLIEAEVYGETFQSIEQLSQQMDAVTLAEAKQAAQKYFTPPGAWVIVAVGPADALAESLKTLGPIEVIP